MRHVGYRLSGYADVMVELRWIMEDDPDGFMEFAGWLDANQGSVTVLPMGAGDEPLGAMVTGQVEQTKWLRVQCPVSILDRVLSELRQACDRAFPRVAGEG